MLSTKLPDLTPPASAPDLTAPLAALDAELTKRMAQLQDLALDTFPKLGELTEKFIAQAFESQKGVDAQVQGLVALATEMARQSDGLAQDFQRRMLEIGAALGTQDAAGTPLPGQIMPMARQIGLMADRIGETADRILFMADRIGEFGDKIVYTIQLIVYMEQMMINFGTLMHEVVRLLADTALGMTAVVTRNDAFFKYQAEIAMHSQQRFELIYQNLGQMLRNMHELSLKMLERQGQRDAQQLAVREGHLAKREASLGESPTPPREPPDVA